MIRAFKDWWVHRQYRRRNAAELRYAMRDPRTRHELYAAADRAHLAYSSFAGTLR